jgi:putative ABC transport system permease protein
MNYNLKIALRKLKSQKTGSIINILGFSIGIAVCLIIVLFVQYEFSFDHYNKNYQTIYRLLQVDDEGRYPDHPVVFNKILEDNIPELQNSAVLYYYNKTTDFFKIENKDFIFKDVMFTNQNFFNIFSLKFIEGAPENALNAPDKIVLTASTARKLFGDQSPIGKTMNYDNNYTFTVSGVIDDLPPTSHFSVDLLASIDAQKQLNPSMINKWWNSSSSFYYNLPANTNIKVLEEKINSIYLKEKPKEYGESTFQLQPLSKIHLYSSDTSWDSAIKGDFQIVKAFILIAILILTIACFNYINLSFALSGKENFQIGVQKTMGANRLNILKSTLTETIILVAICTLISVVSSFLMIPLFNQIMGSQLVFTFSNPVITIALVCLVLFTVFISSFYQSLHRIRLKPIDILTSKASLSFFGKKNSFQKFHNH